MLKTKQLMSTLIVYVKKMSALKNSFIFTTEVLDNQFIVEIWKSLIKMEFDNNKSLFEKF